MSSRFLHFRVFLFLLLLSSFQSFSQNARFYNEATKAPKETRSIYRKILEYYKSMSPQEKEAYLKSTRRSFRGDNAMSPVPRLFSESEYTEITKGVEQRARAIQALLKDHYSGSKTYEDNVIPKKVMERLLRRSGEWEVQDQVDPARIHWLYGPDIIRDPSGAWRVLEDNTGALGGMGDLPLARKLAEKNLRSWGMELPTADNPDDFYATMAKEFRRKAKPKDGVAVIWMKPPYPDKEDFRIQEIFAKNGIEVAAPETGKRVVRQGDAVFLIGKDANGKNFKKRVGFLFMLQDYLTFEGTPKGSPAWKQALITDAKYFADEKGVPANVQNQLREFVDAYMDGKEINYDSLLKSLNETGYELSHSDQQDRIKGLMELHKKGKITLGTQTGVDFVSDKEFTLYVDDLVRFYLNEEPILKNVPTKRMTAKILNDDVLPNIKKYVIKAVDGRGGYGIFVGPYLKTKDIEEMKKAVLANPENFLVQEYTPLSHLDDLIVDLRVHTLVSPDKTFVSPTPWARGQLWKGGDGKVNLSQTGREVAVMVVKDGATCSTRFSKLSPTRH